MIIINTKKAFINAEKLKEKSSSKDMLKDSLDILKIDKTNWGRKCIFILVELVVAIIAVKQSSTILLTQEMVKEIISVVVALLAIVFTGYAFFQALVNKKLLIALLSVEDEQGGNLFMTNKYFAKVMIFQIVCIFMDLMIVIMTLLIPEQYFFFLNKLVKEILATIFIFLILYINFESIWEMKSFIFNVFQLFNLHAYSRMVEICEDEKNDK